MRYGYSCLICLAAHSFGAIKVTAWEAVPDTTIPAGRKLDADRGYDCAEHNQCRSAGLFQAAQPPQSSNKGEIYTHLAEVLQVVVK